MSTKVFYWRDLKITIEDLANRPSAHQIVNDFLVRAGLTIAQLIGPSRDADLIAQRVELMHELHRADYSAQAIAKILHLHRDTVYYHLKKSKRTKQ